MAISRMDDHCLRSIEPRPDASAGAPHVEGIIEDSRLSGDADKTKDRRPRESDADGPIHQGFPPFSRFPVSRKVRIVGVQQQVDVGNDHS